MKTSSTYLAFPILLFTIPGQTSILVARQLEEVLKIYPLSLDENCFVWNVWQKKKYNRTRRAESYYFIKVEEYEKLKENYLK